MSAPSVVYLPFIQRSKALPLFCHLQMVTVKLKSSFNNSHNHVVFYRFHS